MTDPGSTLGLPDMDDGEWSWAEGTGDLHGPMAEMRTSDIRLSTTHRIKKYKWTSVP